MLSNHPVPGKRPVSLCLSLVVVWAGCAGEAVFFQPPAGDSGAGEQKIKPGDGQPPDKRPWDLATIYACDTIDILFVIDNSGTMQQEQENLVQNFPKFISAIEAITPPIKSYHVGVISTDIGAGPTNPSGCTGDGDDGKLQNKPRASSCAASYPLFLSGPGGTLSSDFACIAQLGTQGCGFEQQMESALRALTTQSGASGYNKGFLRKNAPLAIIFITDEDDCSAQDKSLFDLSNNTYGHIPSRCVRYADSKENKLYPISRYVQGFKGLKDNASRLVVAAITGPPGTVKIDRSLPTGMVPSCDTTSFGTAFPGNRFAELIKAFGDLGVQESLCQADLSQSLAAISKAINTACLK